MGVETLAAFLILLCVTTAQSFLQDYNLNSLQRLIVENTRTGIYEDLVPDSSVSTYDFVIVGAGPAGCALANRLSENSNWTILLLEAGNEASFLNNIPLLASLFQHTDMDWGYVAEKQENYCVGCENQRMYLPRGKALGGSTNINYMIQVRGNRIDYDRWAAMGNDGWSYKDVLPYFIKLENAKINIADKGYHNEGGPVSVSELDYRPKIADAIVQAAQEAGQKYVDYNGKEQMGNYFLQVSYIQSATLDGQRWNAEKAYLRPIKNRTNLFIMKNAMATKVLINNETKTAYGVLFDKGDKSYQALASKEVILSAGSFASPQLLTLSGVGPKEDLKELEIPLVKDLPVGKKLMDHMGFTGLLFHVNESVITTLSDFISPNSLLKYFRDGEGPLTSIAVSDVIMFLKTNVSQETEEYPDVEVLPFGGNLAVDYGILFRKSLNINQTTYNGFYRHIEGQWYYQVYLLLTHPKSIGNMKLNSSNVYDHPLFYLNYYSDENNEDMRTLIAAVREFQKINASPALQKYNASVISIPVAGCDDIVFDTDEYWECAIRHLTTTIFHPISTCKMGPETDVEAVVDNKLKVHGINRLRVVDASVIPLQLAAHHTLPVYMIGEKAADIIKEQWS